MSDSGQLTLTDKVGKTYAFDAYVVGLAFCDDDTVAVGLGDGRLAFVSPEEAGAPEYVPVHAGACLSLKASPASGSIISGGDDGKIFETSGAGKTRLLGEFAGKWVENVAVHPLSGLLAVAVGKQVHLFDKERAIVATFDHPSTVGGIVFAPKGRRIAASHYGGVSLWWAKGGEQRAKRLEWSGSHLALAWSPDSRFIITAMQERNLHGWRLNDSADMEMPAYSAKVKAFSWLPKGRYLATSGSEAVICWPFSGKNGPMGKAPLGLGLKGSGVVTIVAAHPTVATVAAGYDDGSVILAQLDRVNPIAVKAKGDGPVSAMAWSPNGQHLVLGTEQGHVTVLSLSNWLMPSD